MYDDYFKLSVLSFNLSEFFSSTLHSREIVQRELDLRQIIYNVVRSDYLYRAWKEYTRKKPSLRLFSPGFMITCGNQWT